MAIEMVRIPSETPNISNIDDFVGLRYAYGNQDGYVANKGNECSYTINGNIFKINSGRLVLQGVECDIDANGVELTIDNVLEHRYYSVYLQVNLALNETKVLATFDTTTYPVIERGDDLTKNSIGTARLILYNFEVKNGGYLELQKRIRQIEYLKNYKVDNADNAYKINNLELKRNELSGVLMIGDVVIPQKKLIWSGSATGTYSSELKCIYLSTYDMYFNLANNTHYVFEGDFNADATDSYYTTSFKVDVTTDLYTIHKAGSVIEVFCKDTSTSDAMYRGVSFKVYSDSITISPLNVSGNGSRSYSFAEGQSFVIYKIYQIIE